MKEENGLMSLFKLDEPKTMTIKEVASAIAVDASTVTKKVRALFPELLQNGVTTYLSEEQVTKVKQAIFNQNGHLGQSSEVPTTDFEMVEKAFEVMSWMKSKIEAQRSKIALLEPKADYYDAVAGSKTAIRMLDVAKTIDVPGMGRTKLFEFLRSKGVLMQDNRPYQQHIDAGRFRVVQNQYQDSKGQSHIVHTTLVYTKGVQYILSLLAKDGYHPRSGEGRSA